MRRVALIAVLWLAAPSAAHAAQVELADRPLLALAAYDGAAYAVVRSEEPAKPLALVRPGEGPEPFGRPGAESPQITAGPDGVRVAWARQISSGLALFEAPAGPSPVTTATAPPQLAADGTLAYSDRDGNVIQGGTRLTDDAPAHRHLPLDAARGLVLDLDQRRTITQLRLLGPDAPNPPARSLPRLADIQGSLAVDAHRAYVAYALKQRIYLAVAELRPGARWKTRKLSNDGAGRPVIARAAGRTYVAFSRAGGVYLNGRRLGSGGRPLLAGDGTDVYVGWTHRGRAVLRRAT